MKTHPIKKTVDVLIAATVWTVRSAASSLGAVIVLVSEVRLGVAKTGML